jgi:hypothetical protein
MELASVASNKYSRDRSLDRMRVYMSYSKFQGFKDQKSRLREINNKIIYDKKHKIPMFQWGKNRPFASVFAGSGTVTLSTLTSSKNL